MSLYLMEISLANVHEVVQTIAQQLEEAANNDNIPLSNLLSLSYVVYKLDYSKAAEKVVIPEEEDIISKDELMNEQ